ncbi:PspC domain-containing protein [Guptibacillus hwajinpoensis]|uniref:PspC domain-containing protein n=1 Tax=Guptibacillus hwajinpoensis TaxID=208199 RepID=UPI003D6B9A07
MKLYKSTTNKKISGVLGGLSEVLNFNSSLLRVIYIILTFVTSGFTLLLYIAAALLLPTDVKQGTANK